MTRARRYGGRVEVRFAGARAPKTSRPPPVGCRIVALLFVLGGCELRELDVLATTGDAGRRDAAQDAGTIDATTDLRDGGDGGAEVTVHAPLAASDQHTCAIFGEELACWGANDRGQLAHVDARRLAPTPLALATTPVAISLGARSTCVLDAAGEVRCVGANTRGQLGLGDADDRSVLSPVALVSAARALSAGAAHVCAILIDDRMYCWGRNDEGQLGIEPLDFDDQPLPVEVATNAEWSAVSAGQGHTLAVTRQGVLLGWGRNSDDELGLGTEAPIQRRTPTQIGDDAWIETAAGQSHSCALRADRRAACFGSNGSAQLGLGDLGDRAVPTPLALEGVDAIATNTFHGCALVSGELFCWGRNVEGQLGTGDTEDRLVPTRIGSDADWSHVATGRFFTCARKRDGRVFCTGANEEGQLGTGDTERRRELTAVAR